MSAPARQPVRRKLDNYMLRLLCSVPLRAEPLRVETPANLDLALSSMVRELARLQMQVEVLQQQIEELTSITRDVARPESRLSVVGETG